MECILSTLGIGLTIVPLALLLFFGGPVIVYYFLVDKVPMPFTIISSLASAILPVIFSLYISGRIGDCIASIFK